MKKLVSILALNILIFWFFSVSANEQNFNEAKLRIDAVELTDPSLPTTAWEQKGLIGSIISRLFDNDGKISPWFIRGLWESTNNNVLRWSDTNGWQFSPSVIFDDGTNVSIWTPSLWYKLGVFSANPQIAQFYFNDGSTNPRLNILGWTNKISLRTTYTTWWADLWIGTATSEDAILIKENWNIGIWNTNPNYKLDVSWDINFTWNIRKNGAVLDLAGKFQDAATSGEIFFNGGNVGIGTNDPSSALHVNSDWSTIFKLSGDQSTLRLVNFSNWNWIQSWVDSTTWSSADLRFSNMNGSQVNAIIKGNWNVGIGTSDPSQKLDVRGNANFNAWGIHTYIGIWSDPNDRIFADNTAAKFYGGGLWFRVNNATWTSYTDTLRLADNGNIWVGKNPINKLDVAGNIGATGWIGAGCEGSCSDVASWYAIMYPNGNIINTGNTNSATFTGNGAGITNINGDNITDNTIDGSEIQNNSLTNADIADGTVRGIEITDNSITSADIAANAVGNSELIDSPTFATILATGYGRSGHNIGHLIGSFNNIWANGPYTNPIYTIGSSYNPASTTLSNMYGIGYSNAWQSSYLQWSSSGWGMYVAADGDARAFISWGAGWNSYFNANGWNVGIWTTTPERPLHVAGTIKAGSTSATNGSTMIEWIYSWTDVANTLWSYYASAATVLWYWVRTRNGAAWYISSADNVAWSRWAIEMTNELVFKNAGAAVVSEWSTVNLVERFKVDSSGNTTISWNLTVWGWINGDTITDNTIDSSEIQNNTITNADIADGTVRTNEIANNTITETDISDSFVARNSNLLDGINGASFLRSDATDDFTWGDLRIIRNTANEIETSGDTSQFEIRQSSTTWDAYMTFHNASDYAVNFGLDRETNELMVWGWSMWTNKYRILREWSSGDYIADNTIDASELQADSVWASELANNSVTGANVIDSSITGWDILNESITNLDIDDGTVRTNEIANNTITNEDINSWAGIAGTKISPNFWTQNIVLNGTDIDFTRWDTWEIRSIGRISFDWTAGTYDLASFHGIESKDEAGNFSDKIRINSFGDIINTIDSNWNSTSFFKVQKESNGNGADLLTIDEAWNTNIAWTLTLWWGLNGDSITDNTIDASELQADSVWASELANDSVWSANIIANSIWAWDIAPNAVGNSELIDSPTFSTTYATQWYGRTAHNNWHLIGSYNNVWANNANTNPIYTIGSNYNPTTTALSNMYGIWYTTWNAVPFIWWNASGWWMYVAADGDARAFISAGAGGNSYFNADGWHIGIWTSSPLSALHVRDTSNGQPTALFQQTGTSPNLAITDAINGMRFEYNSTDDELRIQSANADGTYGWANIATFERSWNVGIGTTSPAQKLAVNGAIDFPINAAGNIMTLENKEFIRKMTDRGGVRIGADDAIVIWSGESPDTVSNGLGSAMGNEQTHIASDNDVFITPGQQSGYNTSRRSIFAANGNVGIGTVSPTQKLDVAGKIRMRTQTSSSDGNDIVATKWYVDNVAGWVPPTETSNPGSMPVGSIMMAQIMQWFHTKDSNVKYGDIVSGYFLCPSWLRLTDTNDNDKISWADNTNNKVCNDKFAGDWINLWYIWWEPTTNIAKWDGKWIVSMFQKVRTSDTYSSYYWDIWEYLPITCPSSWSRTRTVQCINIINNGVVGDGNCSYTSKPTTSQSCTYVEPGGGN